MAMVRTVSVTNSTSYPGGLAVDVNHGAHVTGPQALFGDVLRQDSAVVFLNHRSSVQ